MKEERKKRKAKKRVKRKPAAQIPGSKELNEEQMVKTTFGHLNQAQAILPSCA